VKKTLSIQGDLIRQKNLMNGKADQITPSMIERARDYPFEQLIKFNRAGFATCPWHEEKTPSFHKMKNVNRVYCFGCHEGGDAFAFLMSQEKMTFPEALRSLAERAGIPMPPPSGTGRARWRTGQARMRRPRSYGTFRSHVRSPREPLEHEDRPITD
jgi:hypothetical protein